MSQTHAPIQSEATAAPAPPPRRSSPKADLASAYRHVRQFTETLCQPLATEDYVIQTMESVSPTKWHLAHVSWFFEQFILHEYVPGYEPYHPRYYYLFNSYYNTVGPMHCRPNRGLISRPTVEQVYEYRRVIDDRMLALIEGSDDAAARELEPLITLGLHHEQQHQELLVTDIKHVFSTNPLLPAYRPRSNELHAAVPEADWLGFDEGVYEIGRDEAAGGFGFDNESPRHRVFLDAFAIADRPVTNGEYLRFIEDGGYERPELWLSLGWATINEQGWRHPIYWYRDPERNDAWMHYTLGGAMPIDPAEPAAHLSYFEADAFARWAGARLPTEAEWEVAAANEPMEGTFADGLRLHPAPITEESTSGRMRRAFGDVWEWTQSQYTAYPGYQPPAGALGEYNGKFMCNQFVLRGGSCASSPSHIRPTYRNFFSPEARWQFTGLRLAR